MERIELATTIARRCLLEGEFVLRSGQRASEYFDKYLFESDPGLLRTICEQVATAIPSGTEMLAGLELGGVPLATVLGQVSGLPVVFVRREPKRYGTCRLAEGGEVAGRELLIVEDVVSSGGRIVETTTALRQLGACVPGAVCVVDREMGGPQALGEHGLALTALFTMSELR